MSSPRLTVGKKIAFGFVAIIGLLAIIAGVSRYALNTAGEKFRLFSASAAESHTAVSLEAAMTALKAQVNDFLASGSAGSSAAYQQAHQALLHEITGAEKAILDPARARQIAAAKELLHRYHQGFLALVENTAQRARLEETVLAPRGAAIKDGLQLMMAEAKKQGLADINELELGAEHTCARIGGEVRCWGGDKHGQLGDAATADRPRPAAVARLADAADLALGTAHTCALQTTGNVTCWGSNEHGALGPRRL